MSVFLRANDALIINPAIGVEEVLSLHGSDWLWAVLAVHLIAFFGLLVLCFTVPESQRVFHYLFTIVLLVSSVTYYAQASNLGWSAVTTGSDGDSTRQMFYAKYINWAFSFPSISLALGLLSGVSWTTIISNISICWLWVITYLAAAYTTTSYKWGFFAFGTFSWIILTMSTLNESREAAERLGMTRDYMILAGWASLLWLLYPIAFALSDGSHHLSITGGFIFFGALDVLMVPALSVGFVLLARNWDFTKLHLAFSHERFQPPGDVSPDSKPLAHTQGTSLN
ncbi:hypothetical protein BX600DRAFT_416063 [Xylariales sp. PMI_506]|nr:hypothetical protein BX600DRAFT_416063 [Xylariales sp. PMI_506]